MASGLTFYVNPDTGLADSTPPPNLSPSSRGIVLTPQQRSALMDHVTSMRGSLGTANFFANPDSLSDDQLWSSYVAAVQATGNGPTDLSIVLPLLSGMLVGGAAGSALGGAGGMSTTDAATLGTMTEGGTVGGTMGLTASDAAAGGTAATTGGTTAGGTAASGGGMIDFSGFGSGFDASGFGGQQFDATGFGGDFSGDAFGGKQFDMTGFGSDFDAGTGIGDTSGLSMPNWLQKTLPFLKQFLGGGGGIGGGNGGLFGNGGPSVGSTLPGILALAYASRQPGIDTGPLKDTMAAADANAPLFTQAAIDPVQKNIAAGYGDLLQSQGLRGIRGSSFGNTDVANYLDTTSRTLGDVGATAAQKALGLRGDLASNIATLQAKAQELKNNMFGRAFDVLGRGLSPRPTFDLSGAR